MPTADWFQIGLGGLVLAALVAGAKRVWVWGYQLADEQKAHAADKASLERERDEWKSMALRGFGLTEKAVDKMPEARE